MYIVLSVLRTNSHSIDLNNIYKIALDGTCRIKLNFNATEDMTVSNGWIYYTNISDGYKIYRMKLDGSENTKICDDETLFRRDKEKIGEDHIYTFTCEIIKDNIKMLCDLRLNLSTNEWILYRM